MVYQYHVTSNGKLNSLLLQRSADSLIGLPFNLISAATLQLMLAQQANLTPGELVWVGGDIHLYSNHFDQAATIIAREPRKLPTMRLARKPPSIDNYTIDDFVVEGYDPWPAVHADVAV